MCQTMFRKTLLLWRTNTHYEVQKTTTSTKNFPLLAIGKCPIHNTNHSLNKYRTFRVKSTRERRGPWAISLTYVKVRASTVVPPYPRDNDWTNLNLNYLWMLPHKLQFFLPNIFLKNISVYPYAKINSLSRYNNLNRLESTILRMLSSKFKLFWPNSLNEDFKWFLGLYPWKK